MYNFSIVINEAPWLEGKKLCKSTWSIVVKYIGDIPLCYPRWVVIQGVIFDFTSSRWAWLIKQTYNHIWLFLTKSKIYFENNITNITCIYSWVMTCYNLNFFSFGMFGFHSLFMILSWLQVFLCWHHWNINLS